MDDNKTLCYDSKVKIVKISLQFTAPNEVKKYDTNLDRSIKSISAVCMTADLNAKAYNRCTIRLDVENKEVFKEGFEAKNLMSGLDCPPSQRAVVINRETPSSTILFEAKDNNHSAEIFENYTVNLYLICEF